MQHAFSIFLPGRPSAHSSMLLEIQKQTKVSIKIIMRYFSNLFKLTISLVFLFFLKKEPLLRNLLKITHHVVNKAKTRTHFYRVLAQFFDYVCYPLSFLLYSYRAGKISDYTFKLLCAMKLVTIMFPDDPFTQAGIHYYPTISYQI